MKIALCSKGNFSLEKGFTKNRIELAESLEKLGWETLLVDKQILGIPANQKYNAEVYSLALKNFLIKNSADFDVVLYEYDTLPFDRSLFCKSTLFVARPAILAFHFPLTKFKYDIKTQFSHLLHKIKGKFKNNADAVDYKQIQYCLEQADVIQVQNNKDRELLMMRGFAGDKIILIPNGISAERIARFEHNTRTYQASFTIAFVGTFDFRKGAIDFPVFFSRVKERFPAIRLKLLGTRGIFYTEEQVLKFFPKKHHAAIEVIPQFKSDDLPKLLDDCQVGVFPSYLESFGFGALEMMCAGLPVVAYDCPGPSDFILPGLLAPVGDPVTLADKVISLLQEKDLLIEKANQARQAVVENYCWSDIAEKADQYYRHHLEKKDHLSVPEENSIGV
ncbi:glycosyltransferase [uncultured Pontibacter sp.]|uniref:glycosyltransferase family 4 protein n=1 Tax=uncultured Pontibacter sp. TaxID=453356 RepID=UPI002633143E|nr:glycosyltransferase [uncultured Pontibacter sp.]